MPLIEEMTSEEIMHELRDRGEAFIIALMRSGIRNQDPPKCMVCIGGKYPDIIELVADIDLVLFDRFGRTE